MIRSHRVRPARHRSDGSSTRSPCTSRARAFTTPTTARRSAARASPPWTRRPRTARARPRRRRRSPRRSRSRTRSRPRRPRATSPVTPRQVGLLGLLAAIWGGSYLLIKYCLEGFSAPVIVLGRTLIGALVLLVAVRLRGGLAWAALADARRRPWTALGLGAVSITA